MLMEFNVNDVLDVERSNVFNLCLINENYKGLKKKKYQLCPDTLPPNVFLLGTN